MLDWALSNHSCLAGDAKYSCFRRNEELMYMQSSCKDYPAPEPQPSTTTPIPGECYLPPVTGAGVKAYSFGVTGLVVVYFAGVLSMIIN